MGGLRKSSEALKTIGETAVAVGVKREQLRAWQEQYPAYIRPITRTGGHRLYRPELVQLLFGIKYLLHEEHYSSKGVLRVLKLRGVDFVRTCHQRAENGPFCIGVPGGDDELMPMLEMLHKQLARVRSMLTETHTP